jgi:hypothetical protein
LAVLLNIVKVIFYKPKKIAQKVKFPLKTADIRVKAGRRNVRCLLGSNRDLRVDL